MFDQERRLYAFTLEFCKRLANELSSEELFARPDLKFNPPIWVLGHLAIATDYAASVLGLPRECPGDWHDMFGPGSDASALPQPAPTKEELLTALEQGHKRVDAALEKADPAKLAAPHTVAFLNSTPIKTLGDLLAHLMTTHAAFHLGQLSSWRRQLGYPALF